jgi:hypothetical protein
VHRPDQSFGVVTSLLKLQRTRGNRYVQRLLGPALVQTRLAVSQPDDPLELEADRVAEAVMRMPAPDGTSSAASAAPNGGFQIQRVCTHCEEEVSRQVMDEEEEEEEETLTQAKAVSGQDPELRPEVETTIQSLGGGGQPLPEPVRAFFEPRFNQDFGRVRIHTSARAAESARSVNALAYTVGPNIAFGVGQYAPETAAGQRLLAHELTHVVQQGQSSPLASGRYSADSPPGQPAVMPAAIRPLKVANLVAGLPTIARQVDVEETAAELAAEDEAPMDLDEGEAAEIGDEAMRTVGYDEVIRLALENGLLEHKESGAEEVMMQRQAAPHTIFRQAEAVGFWPVFSRYAIAAGIASQVDSPAPGPGDAVALGILVVGLAVAGATVLMTSRGNVADTGIMQEVNDLVAAGLAAGICEALAMLLRAAQAAGDTAKIRRIQTTQKAKGCRHSRNF